MPDSGPLDVAALRRDYAFQGLDEEAVDPDPVMQFRLWLNAAVAADIADPNAMVLSTVGLDGAPSARTVLLKGLDERGFVFFTNRRSRKAQELAARPAASLLFGWIALGRQVIVRGQATAVADDEADGYFASRPRGSQLAAWASQQSDVVAGRDVVDAAMDAAAQRFVDSVIPRPPHWGGYRIIPAEIEFWQGRENRLHDRLRYRRMDADWAVERLWP